MNKNERILMECRYLLSLNKSYRELSHLLSVDEMVVINDLNNELPKFDQILYKRVQKVLKRINNS